MNKLKPGAICAVYAALICTVFPLAVAPGGYRCIAETKFIAYVVLTVLFLAALIPAVLKDRRSLRKPYLVQWLIAAFWIWSLVSALASPWRSDAFLGGARYEGWLILTLYCAAFAALSLCASSGGFQRPWLPAAALSVCCIVALLQFFDLNPLWLFPGQLRWSGRETVYNGAFLSTVGNADLTASILCTGFAFCWSLAVARRRWLYLLPAAFALVIILWSGIRAGLLGALAGLALCLPAALAKGRKVRLRSYGILLVVCLLLLMLIRLIPMPGAAGELSALLRGQAEDSFGSGRIYIWKNALRLVGERPLLGGGPDTMGNRELFFEKVTKDGVTIRRGIDCAHNEYLNVLVNQGIPALLLLLAALGVTLFRAFGRTDETAAVLRACLVSYMTDAFFGISMPTNAAFFWLIFGLLAAETGAEPQPGSRITGREGSQITGKSV